MVDDSGIPDVQKMSEERNVEGLIKALEYSAYKQPDYEVAVAARQNAAIALGEIGDSKAIEPLIAALGDNNYRVAGASSRALAKIGKPTVEPLIMALGCNADDGVRMISAVTLGDIPDERAVEPLINALLYDKSDVVRRQAATALGKIGDMRAFIPLKKALNDRLVYEWAEWALNKLRRS